MISDRLLRSFSDLLTSGSELSQVLGVKLSSISDLLVSAKVGEGARRNLQLSSWGQV